MKTKEGGGFETPEFTRMKESGTKFLYYTTTKQRVKILSVLVA